MVCESACSVVATFIKKSDLFGKKNGIFLLLKKFEIIEVYIVYRDVA